MHSIARRFGGALLSLVLISTGPVFGTGGAFQRDVDMPGFDYSNLDLPRPSARLCQEACFNDEQCRAWTYVHPAVYGTRAACWLKSRVPEAQPNRCCISGVRQ